MTLIVHFGIGLMKTLINLSGRHKERLTLCNEMETHVKSSVRQVLRTEMEISIKSLDYSVLQVLRTPSTPY